MHHVRRPRAAMLGILPPQKSRHSHPRLPALRHVPGRHHRKGFRRPRRLAASLRLLLLWFSHRERNRLVTLWRHNPRRTRTPALGHASLQATRYIYVARCALRARRAERADKRRRSRSVLTCVMGRGDTRGLLIRARGIATLRGVLDSAVARDLLALFELLGEERPDAGAVAKVFGRLWEGLALEEERLLPDAWQSHLVGRVLDDENPFSLGAEKGEVNPSVLEQARRDLRTLREMFDLDSAVLLGRVESAVPALAGIWVPWTNLEPAEESLRRTIARKLSAAEDWRACAELLAGHYARHGAGPFGRHRAFLWREGRLLAVSRPDPVSLAELVAYEREREPLIRNTERFLAGLPAHHALLYGLPGTGKSSTVKAIMNEYADLRLVEVKKEDLAELPGVLEVLGGRGRRFVLFIDDLSFEEHEVEYKALKALLEGG